MGANGLDIQGLLGQGGGYIPTQRQGGYAQPQGNPYAMRGEMPSWRPSPEAQPPVQPPPAITLALPNQAAPSPTPVEASPAPVDPSAVPQDQVTPVGQRGPSADSFGQAGRGWHGGWRGGGRPGDGEQKGYGHGFYMPPPSNNGQQMGKATPPVAGPPRQGDGQPDPRKFALGGYKQPISTYGQPGGNAAQDK